MIGMGMGDENMGHRLAAQAIEQGGQMGVIIRPGSITANCPRPTTKVAVP